MNPRLIAAAGSLVLASAVLAQGPGEPRSFTLGDSTDQALQRVAALPVGGNRLHVWYRDGRDRPPVLAAVTRISVNGVQYSMATWDGVRWEYYPALDNSAEFGRSTIYDVDGPGPLPETIVALRRGTPGRLSFWDGSAWQALPGWSEATDPSYGEIGTFDPDGDGPTPAFLVAANEKVMLFDGVAWRQIGATSANFNNLRVTASCGYDADGPGPGLPELYIAGDFSAVDAVPAQRIARWDGTNWHALPGAAIDFTPGCLGVRDADGAGPAVPELLVPAPGTYAGHSSSLGAWNGLAWRSVLAGNVAVANSATPLLVLAEPDAPLLLYGSFSSYNGSAVSRIGFYTSIGHQLLPMSSLPGAGFDQGGITSVVNADLDGDGPLPPSLFALGNFETSAGREVKTLARWNGREWQEVTGLHDFFAYSILVAPAAAPGGKETTYYSGGFDTYAGATHASISRFDGTHAAPVGAGLPWSALQLNDIISFDPDGAGPQSGSIIATDSVSIYRFDGLLWRDLWPAGQPPYFPTGMCVHDFDGAGPQPARLIVAGAFNALGQFIQYDGANWSSIGEGIGNQGNTQGGYTAFSHDADGDGPAVPVLYATGFTYEANGVVVNGAAFFDGVQWNPMGDGWGINAPRAMVAHDPDGSGPRAVEIIAGGGVMSGQPARGVSGWNGASWTDLGSLDGITRALALLDGDGDGPAPARLIAGGQFTGALAQWNTVTQQWAALPGAENVGSGVYAIAVERPFGARGPQRLVYSSNAFRITRYLDVGAPWLLEHPAGMATEDGGTVVLRGRVSAAYAGAAYLWQHDGAAVQNGPGGAASGGGVVSGASGVLSGVGAADEIVVELVITGAASGDSGSYSLVLSNSVGLGVSVSAMVNVAPRCRGDFSGDGIVNSQDFFAFLGAFFAGEPRADFDGNGAISSQDFFDFLSAFFTPC